MSGEHDRDRNRPIPDPESGTAGPSRRQWQPVDSGPVDAAGEPVDISDVQFDDEFLDALSRDVPVSTRDNTEYQLAELLSGWRHEVVDTPAPATPTVEAVERAIAASERAGRGRRIVRHLKVVSGAAAVVIVAAAGLTVLSEGSQPGDPLWGVKKVVFAQAASETQAAHDVRSNLEQAEAAMAVGDTAKASSLIAEAESEMGPLRDGDTRNQMNEWIDRLRADAGDPQNPGPATSAPGQPPVSQGQTAPGGGSGTPAPGQSSTSTPPSSAPSTTTTTPPSQPSAPPSTPAEATPTTTPSLTTTTPRPAELSQFPWPWPWSSSLPPG